MDQADTYEMPVVPVLVRAKCKCGGQMKFDQDVSRATWPSAEYLHICTSCHATAIYDTKYPYIEYQEHGSGAELYESR